VAPLNPAGKPRRPNIIMVIRVSTDRQDMARQRADQKKLEQRFGLDVVRTLELHGISGTETLGNRQMQQVLDEMSSPDIDGIGLSALDRLLRPAKRFGQTAMLDTFIDEKKKIWTVREGEVDPNTDEGKGKCWQAMGQASAELLELARRSRDQRIENLKAGILGNASAPYGYVSVRGPEGRMVAIDTGMSSVEGITKRQVVEMVYGWRRQGWKTSKIVRTLNERGILSAGSWGKKDPETGRARWNPPGLWVPQTVLQMLRNSTYCGRRKEWGHVIACEAILSVELWEEVQRINDTSPARTTGRPPVHQYLLAHYLFCAKCRSRMKSNPGQKPNGKHIPNYKCGRQEPRTRKQLCSAPQVRCESIEFIAWRAVWSHITQWKLLLAGTKAYYAAREQNTTGTAKLEKEAAALEKSIDGMQYMVEKGAADPVKTTGKILAAQKRLRAVQAELKEAGKVVFIPSERQAMAACRRLTDPKNEPIRFDHRRSILESIQDLRMEYLEGELTIEGAIPMPSANAGAGSDKSNSSLGRPYTCSVIIPFRIKERIA